MSMVKDITKEDINLLPIAAFHGEIHTIITQEEAIIAANILKKETLLGFDTETRPAFKKGEFYDVSMIQLSTETSAYIFRINFFEMPDELMEVLSSEGIHKAGVAIRDDLKGLRKVKEFTPGGFIELAKIAKEKGIKKLGLRSLAAMFLHVRISKKAQLTNWEKRDLNEGQLLYAATDAWAGRELFKFFDQL